MVLNDDVHIIRDAMHHAQLKCRLEPELILNITMMAILWTRRTQLHENWFPYRNLKIKYLGLNVFTPEKFRTHITAFSCLQMMAGESNMKIPATTSYIHLNIFYLEYYMKMKKGKTKKHCKLEQHIFHRINHELKTIYFFNTVLIYIPNCKPLARPALTCN